MSLVEAPVLLTGISGITESLCLCDCMQSLCLYPHTHTMAHLIALYSYFSPTSSAQVFFFPHRLQSEWMWTSTPLLLELRCCYVAKNRTVRASAVGLLPTGSLPKHTHTHTHPWGRPCWQMHTSAAAANGLC